MADAKLTALVALDETPAAGDLLYLVDVTDNSSKQVTRANLVGGLMPLTGGAFTGAVEFNTQSTFDAEGVNTSSANATTINWTTGNMQKYTNSEDSTFTFTAPDGVADLVLKITHAANANTYTITWPGTVKWPAGTAPTLTSY